MSTRCDLTDSLTDQCAHCRGDTAAPGKVDAVEVSARFEAKYRGPCQNCDRWFPEGEEIGRLADGSGYVCERCLP